MNFWHLAVVCVFAVGLLGKRVCAGGDECLETSQAVRRAEEAIALLQQELQNRLLSALQEQGPVGAVKICRIEAGSIAHTIAKERGIELGRTSHKLRNPSNAPRTWMVPYLERAAGQPASSVSQVVVDLDGRVGVLRPIATGGLCLVCHGPRESFDPELRAVLSDLYPEDRATGFREGEFRGFFWAEVRKSQ